jgi:hypothetical protein
MVWLNGRRGSGFLLLSVLLAGACGSSDAGDAGMSLEAVPGAYAAAACEAVTACLGSAVQLFLNGQDCEETTSRSVSDLLEGITDGLESGRVRYDGTHMAACLDALGAAGCDYDKVGDSPDCLAALDGTVEVGDDCDHSAECEGTAYCRSSGSCPGKCARAEAEGGACTADSDCDRALECDESRGECFTPASAGDRCGGGTEPECGPGLFCLGANDDDGTPGTCRRLTEVLSAREGAACDPALGPLCGPNLHCVILSVTPAITAECRKGAASGAACAVGFPDPCPVAEYCKAPQGTLKGTCTDRPGAGDPCAAGPFGDPADICAPGTVCDGGTCRTRQSLGGTCASDAVCLSEHCVARRCALDGGCG